MNARKNFFDTNTLLYLLSDQSSKAEWVTQNLDQGSIISVQVLNEFTSVSIRKSKLLPKEIDEFLEQFIAICNVQAIDLDTFASGREISRRYGYHHYDSMIIASALQSGCEKLYSEDMQHRQIIDKRLHIVNPFI
ncbi:PIN domain-containing protein [Polynucleobacter antarcticus]|uniref:VapC toxin family PIN domain ribonuclease n=1 Tax=Polynucleobacter antarcticus TaxID=1743162 RepID=A0A6M9PN38_9BURK|nr:PIN domain-containing protein [Polynucleobacter antarcticus]QKM63714.1 VapC toxin family PIN domain ribonuclease [Polynucleobacter antarcticus]